MLEDLGSCTSLHGVKNFVRTLRLATNNDKPSEDFSKRKTLIAKIVNEIIWGGTIVFGAVLLIVMISLTWGRIKNTAILTTTVDTHYHPNWKVPFPALTLCNINQIHRKQLNLIIDEVTSIGINESAFKDFSTKLRHLVHSYQPINLTSIKELETINAAMSKLGYKIDEIMTQLAQPCESMVKRCRWLGKKIRCSKIFHISKTSEGSCCSFNYNDVAQRYINITEYRVSGAGDMLGLELLLSPDINDYFSYARPTYGINMIIHPRSDFPDMKNVLTLLPGYEMKIGVQPSILQTDESLRSLPASQRPCLFDDEVNLMTHAIYSHSNCVTECRVAGYIKYCKCIPFYFPHVAFKYYGNVSQCNLTHINCMNDIREIVTSLQPQNGAALQNKIDNRIHEGLKCDCKPGCNEVNYEVQTISSDRRISPVFNLTESKLVTRFNIDSKRLLEVSTLSLGFTDTICLKYRCSLYSTWDNLLASIGGIFGLCLGGSMISLVEFAHFILVRVLRNMPRRIATDKHENKKKKNPKQGKSYVYRITV